MGLGAVVLEVAARLDVAASGTGQEVRACRRGGGCRPGPVGCPRRPAYCPARCRRPRGCCRARGPHRPSAAPRGRPGAPGRRGRGCQAAGQRGPPRRRTGSSRRRSPSTPQPPASSRVPLSASSSTSLPARALPRATAAYLAREAKQESHHRCPSRRLPGWCVAKASQHVCPATAAPVPQLQIALDRLRRVVAGIAQPLEKKTEH